MGSTYTKPQYDNSYPAVAGPDALPSSPALAVHSLKLPAVSLEFWTYRYAKRTIDLVLASMMTVVLFAPAVLIAVLVCLSSAGPIFYREERIGRGGSSFRIWKFRTMFADAHLRSCALRSSQSGAIIQWRMVKHLRDPRITPVGRMLRSWSLDEIPQLINILRGEMSLVGPRPIVQAESGFYADSLPLYLAATPGLTGLWQVSGRCGIDYAARVAMDAKYVSEWSLSQDLMILLRTVPAVLGRDGAR